ncbi:protein lin-37 homolog [Ruditapes philippinarum]|uniref:protein lin-37 homolog n=1 Tax=Ruditapes philippinarum TaxID=129788 RepID=UPI00295C07FF|nr:protein lin-37 homolog [Ruditapes philippinarum]XP_060555160.1 protein lin-37 homolog [Ruditapes philippinarum]
MYLSTKAKPGRSLYTKEVSNARTRLDATLQLLVDKKDESAESTAESDDEPDIQLPINVPVVRSSGSPAASPVKRLIPSSSQRSKKRKRKHDSMDATDAGSKYHHTTYIMKLFDRSVDLAQFNENTPLYPIARAWMKDNSATDEAESSQGESSADEKDDPTNVFKMPTPIKLKFERGVGYQDTRIPPPILSNDAPLDIHKDPDLGPAPEELLLRHMARWKNIRQSWINAARINELKYNNSIVILKDMFERNLQSQESSQE